MPHSACANRHVNQEALFLLLHSGVGFICNDLAGLLRKACPAELLKAIAASTPAWPVCSEQCVLAGQPGWDGVRELPGTPLGPVPAANRVPGISPGVSMQLG